MTNEKAVEVLEEIRVKLAHTTIPIGDLVYLGEKLTEVQKYIAATPPTWISVEDIKLREQCRHYLMSVDPKDLTVEDCLEYLGYGRDGLNL